MSADRLAEHRAWQTRRAAVIARYGSAEAALAPCARERRILDSVEPWRERWVDSDWTRALDGWRGSAADWDRAPARVLAAIRNAYPLPTSFTDAVAEMDHWARRDAEIADVEMTDGPPTSDGGLDLPAALRWSMVRALVECELPAITLQDVRTRLAMLRAETVSSRADIEAALDRDFAAIIEREAAARPPAAAQTAAVQRGRLAKLLRANPGWSDRRIAREAMCSPTTAGKARRELGAVGAA